MKLPIKVPFWTIVRKEVVRFMRIWPQTLLPAVVTTVLYFIIFGQFIGSQIKPIEGFTYMQFIVPGLIMMSLINSAFSNVVSSFFGAKFSRNIEELIISPTPNYIIIAGYVTGGVIRAALVSAIVFVISLFFTSIAVQHVFMGILFAFLAAVLFSLAGLLNAIFAKDFDDISIFPTFVLTPLIYLGGVFYSIQMLPPFWSGVSQFNPILYMINGFRYSFLGITDVSPALSMGVLLVFIALLTAINWRLLARGTGMKS
ncbi:MAG: ABC transporter permease [bacterium]|nr:ABC transporter permease [bacterium]